ncbi:DUF4276 family protein [Streptomyces hoynatensis]|uniref:DUF4276 family protein n=1 Tax=Streptomyces hoynatensis TaxID=1141874 RepID=A0A3A9Z0G2_9ACTN|nr:DUF4276 family protein [Streptomyces hoynatensis]RKN41783.1 DUF4276 family protein [Streptomyces hoynatensis]
MTLRVLFLSEGSSDGGLVPHIEKIAAQVEAPVIVSAPDLSWLRQPVGREVSDKLQAVRRLSDDYDLALPHRDADKFSTEARRDEISTSAAAAWPGLAYVPVIPVRMLEAWLLLDEAAIRQVAGNPRGRVNLQLPKASSVEKLPDPKKFLKETIAKASELRGRRLEELNKRFPRNRHRLLELLDVEGPVSEVTSWKVFVSELTAALRACLR